MLNFSAGLKADATGRACRPTCAILYMRPRINGASADPGGVRARLALKVEESARFPLRNSIQKLIRPAPARSCALPTIRMVLVVGVLWCMLIAYLRSKLGSTVVAVPQGPESWNFEWGLLEGPFMCDIDGSGTNVIKNILLRQDRERAASLTGDGGSVLRSRLMSRRGHASCPGGGDAAYLDVVLQYPRDMNVPFFRQMEYANAVLCNLAQAPIRRIHLLQESGTTDGFRRFLQTQVARMSGLGSESYQIAAQLLAQDPCKKLVVIPIGKRLTYAAALQYANENFHASPALITNADISVSSGFESEQFVRMLSSNQRVHLVSRYENEMCPNFATKSNHKCSCGPGEHCYDSFLVRPPVKIDYKVVDFRVGALWNSEDIFAGRLHEAGIALSNPCLALRLKHHHCSHWRGNQARDAEGNEIFLNDVAEKGWKDNENRARFLDYRGFVDLWANSRSRATRG